jgi:hypothetical protein
VAGVTRKCRRIADVPRAAKAAFQRTADLAVAGTWSGPRLQAGAGYARRATARNGGRQRGSLGTPAESRVPGVDLGEGREESPTGELWTLVIDVVDSSEAQNQKNQRVAPFVPRT